MSIENVVLIVAALVNLLMSVIVISRGWRNKVNLSFSFLTFFNSLWAISLLLVRNLNFYTLFFSQLTYINALGIAISLFYFTLYFPLVIKKISLKQNLLIILLFVFLVFIIFFESLFIVDFNKNINEGYQLFFNKNGYIFYSLYFLFLSALSLYNLFIKYKKSEQPYKNILGTLALSIIFGLVWGVLFDLILPYLNIWSYEWLGPIFTVFMNAYVFYLIFINSKNN